MPAPCCRQSAAHPILPVVFQLHRDTHLPNEVHLMLVQLLAGLLRAPDLFLEEQNAPAVYAERHAAASEHPIASRHTGPGPSPRRASEPSCDSPIRTACRCKELRGGMSCQYERQIR